MCIDIVYNNAIKTYFSKEHFPKDLYMEMSIHHHILYLQLCTLL